MNRQIPIYRVEYEKTRKVVANFINADIIYWQRHTNNLALTADISATSGDFSYLNDFKLVDTEDVVPTKCNYKVKCWRPEHTDNKKIIEIAFDVEVKTEKIAIYFNNLHRGNHGKGHITIFSSEGIRSFDEEFSIPEDEFSIVTLDVGNADSREIHINLNNSSDDIGIGEIEILPEQQEIPFAEYLLKEHPKNKSNIVLEAFKRLDYISFKIQTKCYLHFQDQYRKKRLEFDKENSEQ